MSRFPKILIVGLNQLPHRYLHNQCSLLADSFDLTVVSPDEALWKPNCEKYRSVYLNTRHPKSRIPVVKKYRTFIRIIDVLFQVKKYLSCVDYDLIYIWDQTWAFAFKLIMGPKYKYVMQMFAPGVTSSKFKNAVHDLQVRFNVLFFKHVFLGSEVAMRFFKVPDHKAHITGVGIAAVDYRERAFVSMDLVYLGALSNRYVHESVQGFAKFFSENKDKIPMSYKIIGGGYQEAVQELKASIKAAGDDIPVEYLGRLDDDDLIDIFKRSNIGVVYNRVTPYYTNNISTKLYEYLLSGMPVIAVRNNSLLKAVNADNGVLIEDNPEGFERGLNMMMNNLNRYNSQRIAQSGDDFSVRKVVMDRMIPIFNEILGGK